MSHAAGYRPFAAHSFLTGLALCVGFAVSACSAAPGDSATQGSSAADSVEGKCTGGFICGESDPFVKGFKCSPGSVPSDSNPKYICSQPSPDGTNEYCCEDNVPASDCGPSPAGDCPFPKIGFTCNAGIADAAPAFGQTPSAVDPNLICDQGMSDPNTPGNTLYCCAYGT